MQFLVELDQDGDGRVSGLVTAGMTAPVAFSGWLELLRLLEDSVGSDTRGAHDQLGDGRDGQERT